MNWFNYHDGLRSVCAVYGTTFVSPSVGPRPTQLQCPSCHQHIVTRMNYEMTTRTHICAALLCLIWWVCSIETIANRCEILIGFHIYSITLCGGSGLVSAVLGCHTCWTRAKTLTITVRIAKCSLEHTNRKPPVSICRVMCVSTLRCYMLWKIAQSPKYTQ